MKFAGVNIYGHPNICEDQHRLKFFYLELKRNPQFHISRTNHNPFSGAPYDKRRQKYEKTFALKLFGSHTTRIVISIQLQIKYI
jgi:hypothetical protein